MEPTKISPRHNIFPNYYLQSKAELYTIKFWLRLFSLPYPCIPERLVRLDAQVVT